MFPAAGHPTMISFVEGIRKISLEYKRMMELSTRGQLGPRARARAQPTTPTYYQIPEDYETFTPAVPAQRSRSQRK